MIDWTILCDRCQGHGTVTLFGTWMGDADDQACPECDGARFVPQIANLTKMEGFRTNKRDAFAKIARTYYALALKTLRLKRRLEKQ